MHCLSGYRRSKFSKMRYFTQVYITDQYKGLLLPKNTSGWVEDKILVKYFKRIDQKGKLCFNSNWETKLWIPAYVGITSSLFHQNLGHAFYPVGQFFVG